ncbi:MAG: hypothetical protein L0271_19660 [Gemmatimonadetes bacterium]|nr:hypothetical protein [Gemmatimonadota bacterium]
MIGIACGIIALSVAPFTSTADTQPAHRRSGPIAGDRPGAITAAFARGPQQESGEAQDTLIPAGYGTLKQDEVTVALRSGPLLIKVTPLDEGIIRTLSPDTYQRLHTLAGTRGAEAASAALGAKPALFMVSFFSYEADVEYVAENLQLSHRGRLLNPVAVMPVTPAFGRQQLAQQETQVGIYAFDEAIDYRLPIIVRYGAEESSAWNSIIPKLEVERAKIRARASGPDPPPDFRRACGCAPAAFSASARPRAHGSHSRHAAPACAARTPVTAESRIP